MSGTLERWFGRPEGAGGALAGIVMARENAFLNATAVRALDLRPDDRVLEVGCGPGVGVRTVVEHEPAAFVAGIDPSPVMVRQAARRNRRQIAKGRVEIRPAPAEEIPYGDGRFTCVFSVNSLHHWDRTADGLEEIHRVLAPGGRLVLAERLGPASAGRLDLVGRQLADTGFVALRRCHPAAGSRPVALLTASRPRAAAEERAPLAFASGA